MMAEHTVDNVASKNSSAAFAFAAEWLSVLARLPEDELAFAAAVARRQCAAEEASNV